MLDNNIFLSKKLCMRKNNNCFYDCFSPISIYGLRFHANTDLSKITSLIIEFSKFNFSIPFKLLLMLSKVTYAKKYTFVQFHPCLISKQTNIFNTERIDISLRTKLCEKFNAIFQTHCNSYNGSFGINCFEKRIISNIIQKQISGIFVYTAKIKKVSLSNDSNQYYCSKLYSLNKINYVGDILHFSWYLNDAIENALYESLQLPNEIIAHIISYLVNNEARKYLYWIPIKQFCKWYATDNIISKNTLIKIDNACVATHTRNPMQKIYCMSTDYVYTAKKNVKMKN